MASKAYAGTQPPGSLSVGPRRQRRTQISLDYYAEMNTNNLLHDIALSPRQIASKAREEQHELEREKKARADIVAKILNEQRSYVTP